MISRSCKGRRGCPLAAFCIRSQTDISPTVRRTPLNQKLSAPASGWLFQQCAHLRLEYEAGMAILVAFFPNRDDLVDRNIADVVIFVLELKDAFFNPDYFAAEARRASANNVNLSIDHFG